MHPDFVEIVHMDIAAAAAVAGVVVVAVPVVVVAAVAADGRIVAVVVPWEVVTNTYWDYYQDILH